MKTMIVSFVILILAGGALLAEDAAPSGVLSLTPVEQSSYIAVRSTLPDSVLIGGVAWYNNDATTVFPTVLLAAAADDGSPDLGVTAQLGVDVSGDELAWSGLTLAVPVLNDVGDLFVVMQLPPYEIVAEPGVGPGIGYMIAEGAPCAYLSTDGQEWTAVGTNVALMLEAVPATTKSGAVGIMFQRPEIPIVHTELFDPSPNPFNPSTELKFTLAAAGDVELVIYDLRGRKVKTLMHDDLESGEHTATWMGQDDAGARVASGMYLARLSTDTKIFQKRMVLLK